MLHLFTHVLFWAGKQGNHQNFDPSMLPKKLWLIFMEMKQKYKLFSECSFQNGSKSEIFKTTNSQNSENLYFISYQIKLSSSLKIVIIPLFVKYRGPILRVTWPALGSNGTRLQWFEPWPIRDEYSNFAGACAGHLTRFFIIKLRL